MALKSRCLRYMSSYSTILILMKSCPKLKGCLGYSKIWCLEE
jgi:hypothetical protein